MSGATSILINVGAKTGKAVSELNKVNQALGKQQTAAQKTGAALKKMQGPAVAALGAVGLGAAASVKAASNLGETFNAVDKVFGKASGTITDFGENSAQAVGLSQRAFQELATNTGSLLGNMGQSQKEAADNTLLLTTRAADMASVFNTDVDSALNAINAGLRGESEPLRQFGVQLSDAAIKQQALSMNLYSGKGALDASARAAAVQALIMEQTAKTAGDFSETQDGVANGTRTVQATIEDLSAQFGEVLLPYVETGIALFADLLTWIEENEGKTKVLIATVTGLAAAIVAANVAMKLWRIAATTASIVKLSAKVAVAIARTVAYHVIIKTIRLAMMAWTAIQWALNIALNANPIGLVIAAIALLVGAVVLAYKKSDTFRAIIDGLWRVLKGAFKSALNGVTSAFKAVVGGFKSAWEWVGKLIDKIKDLLSNFNPLKKLGGLLGFAEGGGSPGISPFGPGGTRSRPGNVTINVYGTADPVANARLIKRALERDDVAQGRYPGAPLRVAW
jgi:hypothetical protein